MISTILKVRKVCKWPSKAAQTSLAQSHFKPVNSENNISIRGELEDMCCWACLNNYWGVLCWIALLHRKMVKRHKQVISRNFSEQSIFMELESQVKWGECWRVELAWQGKKLTKAAIKISALLPWRLHQFLGSLLTVPTSSSCPSSLCLQTLLCNCCTTCLGRTIPALGSPWAEEELAVSISSKSCAFHSLSLQRQGTHKEPVFVLPAVTQVHCDVLSPAMPVSSCWGNMTAHSIQESWGKTIWILRHTVAQA